MEALASSKANENERSGATNGQAQGLPVLQTAEHEQFLSKPMFDDVAGDGMRADDNDVVITAPPDGGYGWVIVVCSAMVGWVISTNITGFAMLYVAFTDYFQADKGVAGWIGSVNFATGNFFGLIFSVIIKKQGCRFLCILGGIISTIGFLISALAPNVLFLYLSFGYIAGMGSGMMFLSTAVIVQQYFTSKRALAAGLASAGMSMGTLTAGPTVQFLVDNYGWRGAMVINAGVYLQCCVFGALLRPVSQYTNKRRGKAPIYRVQKEKNGATRHSLNPTATKKGDKSSWKEWKDLCNFTLLKNTSFLVFCIGNMLCAFGFLAFYQHTPSRAVFYGLDIHKIAYLPTVTGLFTVISRITFGFVANCQCVDRTVQYAVATIISGLLSMAYVTATTYVGFLIFCILIGSVNGAYFTVTTTVVVDLLGIEHAAKGQAISSLFMGTGFLLGTPFAGWIFDLTGDYNIPFYVTGSVQALGGVMILVPSVLKKLGYYKEKECRETAFFEKDISAVEEKC